jgi:hypothetical protein
MESDDEPLMRELAAAGELRDRVDDIDARLRELTGTVAEHGAKLLVRPITARPWNWKEFSDSERAAALAEPARRVGVAAHRAR